MHYIMHVCQHYHMIMGYINNFIQIKYDLFNKRNKIKHLKLKLYDASKIRKVTLLIFQQNLSFSTKERGPGGSMI